MILFILNCCDELHITAGGIKMFESVFDGNVIIHTMVQHNTTECCHTQNVATRNPPVFTIGQLGENIWRVTSSTG